MADLKETQLLWVDGRADDGAYPDSGMRLPCHIVKSMVAELQRHRAAKAAGATPSVQLSSDEIDQLRHHIAEHRATCAYSCSLLERLLAAHGAKP